MVSDDPIHTFAIRDKQLISALGAGVILGCGGPEDAEARIEAWKYDPSLLADGNNADRLSVYLSLRHSADERVQKELQTLVSGMFP